MKKVFTIVVAAGLTLGGVAYGVSANDDVLKSELVKPAVKPEQAKQIALENVNGNVREMDFDNENGEYVYEVEVATNEGQKEVRVNAKTGAADVKNDDQNDGLYDDIDDPNNDYNDDMYEGLDDQYDDQDDNDDAYDVDDQNDDQDDNEQDEE